MQKKHLSTGREDTAKTKAGGRNMLYTHDCESQPPKWSLVNRMPGIVSCMLVWVGLEDQENITEFGCVTSKPWPQKSLELPQWSLRWLTPSKAISCGPVGCLM